MKKQISLSILICTLINLVSYAEAAPCYKREVNPSTSKRYTSSKKWRTDRDAWDANEPAKPSLIELAYGNHIAESVKATAESLGNDKAAHCYTGCRIAKDTNYKTAVYAGWYKESQDIKDCKASTHFDQADYDATELGAEIGDGKNSNCKRSCTREFPPIK